MKKLLILVVMCLSFPALYASDETAAAQTVTPAAKNAVIFDGASGSITMIAKAIKAPATIGITGLSFRFLNSKWEGFEIPVGISFSSSGADQSGNNDFRVGGSIYTGYKLIIPSFMNEYIRIYSIPGITGSYQFQYEHYNSTSDPAYTELSHSFGLTLYAGLEIEVPIGKLLSLPPNTICVSSGVSVYGGGTVTTNYVNGKYKKITANMNCSTGSSGTSLTTLSVRYYF